MDNIDQFAVWDPQLRTVTFKLIDKAPLGLHRAAVTLNDGRLTSEY